MSINASCNDLFEVEYTNKAGETAAEFFPLAMAKDFVIDASNKGNKIISVTYFIELLISGLTPNIATQPHRRFGEHRFEPKDFLGVSSAWVDDVRTETAPEIDKYMADRYGATLTKSQV